MLLDPGCSSSQRNTSLQHPEDNVRDIRPVGLTPFSFWDFTREWTQYTFRQRWAQCTQTEPHTKVENTHSFYIRWVPQYSYILLVIFIVFFSFGFTLLVFCCGCFYEMKSWTPFFITINSWESGSSSICSYWITPQIVWSGGHHVGQQSYPGVDHNRQKCLIKCHHSCYPS